MGVSNRDHSTPAVRQSDREAHTDEGLASTPASPIVADVLRRARSHQRLSLRQVEQRIGVPNAHISQIERGVIRRPDVAILMELAELYELDYQLLAQWAGYLDAGATRTSSKLAGMALRLFASLDPTAQHDALNMLEELRNGTMHVRRTAADKGDSATD